MKKHYRANSEVNLYQAFDVWHRFYSDGENTWEIRYKHSFGDFLGGYQGNISILQSWRLTEDSERKARMLLGSHARTIVKIYFSQHPHLSKPPLL